MPLVLYLRPG